MKFADLHVGMVIKSASVTVDEDEMLAFSQRYDPQWFHVDAARARTGVWKGLIASGWMTGSIAMRLAVDAFLHDSDSFGSPGLDSLKWLHPVRAGDTLRLEVTIDGIRKSSSKPDLRIVSATWRLFNQDNVQVVEIIATHLFDVNTAT